MLASRVLLALAALGGAAAVCPNACSGHGTCSEDDVCFCYQDWGMGDENSGDCSQKFCAFEFAFVDTPDEDGKVHKYMECSGKGICDRSSGECEYFDELTFGSPPGEYYAAKPSNFSMGISSTSA